MSRWARLRAVALSLVVLVLGPACSHDRPPSVLLITVDTLRADALEAFGGEPGAAPNLSALAASGEAFLACSTVTPLTLPAHASLLTGLRPARHGLTVNGVSLPSLPGATLAERLSEAGYETGAFVSALVLDRRHGLDVGFDHYDDDLNLPGSPPMPTERDGAATVDRALSWLDERSEPWFAWVHLFDPHAPYAAPGGRTEPARAAYADEVAHVDAQIGRLLAGLPGGALLIVMTADHGEGLGDHGEATHGVLLNETTVHVPLVLALRGASDEPPLHFPRAGQRRTDPVSLLDVTPTVLELLALAPLQDVDGLSLARPVPQRVVPLESRSPLFYYGFSPLAGARQGALKLVAAPRADPKGLTVVDLGEDPQERRPASVDAHALVVRLPSTEPTGEARASADASGLAALGYLGSGTPSSSTGALRDPRDALDLVEGIDAANTALVQGRALDALARLQPLADDYPEVPELSLFLGRAYRALGRREQAVAALQRAAELQPASVGLLHEWCKALIELDEMQSGDGSRARAVLAEASRLAPRDPEGVALVALVEVLFGDPNSGLETLDAALVERPRAANLLLVKARALERLGRAAEAAALRASLPLQR